MKNRFVSIYFTSNKLLLLMLNSKMKKVETYATIDLPEGVIQNHEIKNIKLLSEILTKVWQKLKIKERFVGIVIPEFSTFTKAMDLPKLDISEIDEAVKWQADEYIPIDPEDMLLDWKIIDDKTEELRVLAVAVNKKILNGYVEAADMAGLYPLVVETPSLSLVRAAGEDPTTKIVVYFSFDEIVITLSAGLEILTSSVIAANSTPQMLSSTISRIIRHFDKLEISKIFVGGVPANNSYIPELTNSFKVRLEKLQYRISGMNDIDLQKYTIPISMQFKDAYEPSSPKTINLLPPEITSKYKNKKNNIQLWGLMLIVTLVIVGCLMALVGTYFYLVQGLSKYDNFNSLSDVSYQKSKTASDRIKTVNTLADKTLKIDSVNYYPQDLLNSIYRNVPENVVITTYKIDLEKGLVTLSGLSAGRSDLLNFKEKMEESGDFQKIILPITSFEQEENIDFVLSAIYTKLAPAVKTSK